MALPLGETEVNDGVWQVWCAVYPAGNPHVLCQPPA